MRGKDKKNLADRKGKLDARLANIPHEREAPMLEASRVSYEVAGRTDATAHGGIPAMHQLAKRLGLAEALDAAVCVFKRHFPYHESDHILNIAFNALAGGSCLEDLELRRTDSAYLNALGAERVPDPTTAGDFLRRFDAAKIETLQEAINDVRTRQVWSRLPRPRRRQAVLNVDGIVVETTGECKEGIGLSYKGKWGYHPLVISLAETREALYIVNRPGNAVSHQGSVPWIDKAIARVKPFWERVALRGDSDFSLTWKFDGWTDADVAFYFGYDTREPLTGIANAIPEKAWKYLDPEPKYPVKTEPRRRPENVKERLVVANEYDNLKPFAEQVAEIAYRPTKCRRDYRVIVLRKHYTLEKGQSVLFASERYFFYITNDWRKSAEEILEIIRERCDHENDLDQLKNGVLALRAPSNTIESNGAFMVIQALAWNLKAWYGLLMPDKIAGAEIVRMEFRRFVNGFMNLPAQVLKAARGIHLRLLAYNRHVEAFLAMFAWIRRLGVT